MFSRFPVLLDVCTVQVLVGLAENTMRHVHKDTVTGFIVLFLCCVCSFKVHVLYLASPPSAAHNDFGHFYGSSYVAAPDGSRTPVSWR